MGKLAQKTQGTQLQKANPADDMKSMVEAHWDRMAAVLPKHMSPERMLQLAISTMNKNPKLANCTPVSLLSCFMTSSALGLEPNDVNGLGQCYIIPYGNTATFIPGFRGLYKLALNSGEISSITVELVYKGDEFEYAMGDDAKIVHKPSMTAEHKPENVICGYCITHLNNGGIQRTVMSRSEIDKRRNVSKSKNSGPWVDWTEEMMKKTVIRQAAKLWPLSSEKSTPIQEAAMNDEQVGGFYSDMFSKPVIEQEAAEAPIEAEAEVVPAEAANASHAARRAVCKHCGNVVDGIAPDATAADIDFLCCDAPAYEIEG